MNQISPYLASVCAVSSCLDSQDQTGRKPKHNNMYAIVATFTRSVKQAIAVAVVHASACVYRDI